MCHQLVAAVTRALLPVVEPSYRWRIAGLGDVYAVYRKTYDNVWNIDGGGATGTAWEEKRENIDALRSVKKKEKRPVVERKNVFPQHVSHWMDA